MKTRLETIKENCNSIAKGMQDANQIIQRLRERSERSKRLINELKAAIMPVILLFIMTSLSAQSFEKINGLGMKEPQVIIMISHFSFFKGSNLIEGNRMDFYHSSEYGLVGYIYNKDNICIKVALPTVSSHVYDVTGFNAIKKDDCNITLITRKNDLSLSQLF